MTIAIMAWAYPLLVGIIVAIAAGTFHSFDGIFLPPVLLLSSILLIFILLFTVNREARLRKKNF